MAGQETLTSHRDESGLPKKPGHRKERRRASGGFKQLSDRTPLRVKLITAMLALVIMALAAISVASVFVLRSYLYNERDPQLMQSLHMYEHQLSGTQLGANEAYGVGAGMVVALQEPGNQLTAGTGFTPPGMSTPHQTQPLPKLPGGTWANSSGSLPMTVPSQSGSDVWRLVGQAFNNSSSSTGAQQTVIFLVAVDLGPVGAEIQRLITVELIVGAAIVVVLAVVGVAVVRANLRPLDDIEMTAGEIAKGHLDHRVPEGDPRTEIGSLGRSLNVMLTQIETAFHAQGEAEQSAHQSEERMRRFIADAAHELRTPLTTIRGFAAHYRQRGGAGRLRLGSSASGSSGVRGAPWEDQNRSSRTETAYSVPVNGSAGAGAPQEGLAPEELDHLMGRVESEATRMGMLVEDLLTLARLDQQRPLNFAPVDLLTLAADAVQDARIVSPGRPIDLTVAPGTAFIVNGDEPRLRQVIANLVNNAITHTPAGTPIRVKIARGSVESRGADGNGGATDTPGRARQDDWGGAGGFAGVPGAGRQAVPAVMLDVEDDGPGMSADQAQRVFERFYRADAARNRASGGTGLGLAIVAGLVSAHGGTVSVRTAPGQGADFQVKLPLSPDALVVDDPDD
jgi:two-component system OmpR family sensor kinase